MRRSWGLKGASPDIVLCGVFVNVWLFYGSYTSSLIGPKYSISPGGTSGIFARVQ